MSEERRYLGPGRSCDYEERPGFVLEEAGLDVYEVPVSFFCTVCDGCGCRCCGFTGEEGTRQDRNKAGKNGPKKKKKDKP